VSDDPAIFATAAKSATEAGRIATALSDRIWDYAEPGFCEAKSATALCETLRQHGFDVTLGVAGLPTAFVASYGAGQPRIALMCEYDATPGESQRPSPFPDSDPNRPCGFTDLHNGIGAASVGAAIAIRTEMEAHRLPGTLVVFGTPAEKLCVGKPFMARAGLFDGLDAVIAWHPRAYSTLEWDQGPGCYQAEIFDFFGRSAYGSSPWHGVSALDAVTLMNVIVQFQREHLPRAERISINEMISHGGDHPTALPNRAQAWYVHRAATRAGIETAAAALTRAAEAAALALEARCERTIVAATRPWLPNHALAELCFRNLQRAGAPRFSDEARRFAADVLRSLGREAKGDPFDETLTPPSAGASSEFEGADDVTEFCWHAPTARIYVAYGVRSGGLPNWARSAFTRTSVAHASIATAVRAMAFSVLDILAHPGSLDDATREFRQRSAAGSALQPLIPPEAKPPIDPDHAPPYVRDQRLRDLSARSGSPQEAR
jgi:aminobenzoyl-glutamate utilization protein B